MLFWAISLSSNFSASHRLPLSKDRSWYRQWREHTHTRQISSTWAENYYARQAELCQEWPN